MLDIIKQQTEKLLNVLAVEYEEVEVFDLKEFGYRVNVLAKKDSALLIGWHGQTLLSLQTILHSILGVIHTEPISISFDIENYRKKQEDNIIELAKRKAQRVLETGESELMPPMHAYYRRIIHQFFTSNIQFAGISTESTGEGAERQIRILKS